MAIGRLIRKSIFKNRKVGKLDILSKLLYTWSVIDADRDGRIDADIFHVKAHVCQNLDIDTTEIDTAIATWATIGLGVLYEDDNGEYFQFNNFLKHQNLAKEDGTKTTMYNRERESTFPAPQSCKIIAGKAICDFSEVTEKLPRSLQEVDKKSLTQYFIQQIAEKAYSPASYEPMTAPNVISFVLGWLLKQKDVLLPARSTQWDNITSRDRGIAKGIGKVEKRDEFNFKYSGIFQSSEEKEVKELSLQTFCSKAAEDTELKKNLKRILPKNVSFQ